MTTPSAEGVLELPRIPPRHRGCVITVLVARWPVAGLRGFRANQEGERVGRRPKSSARLRSAASRQREVAGVGAGRQLPLCRHSRLWSIAANGGAPPKPRSDDIHRPLTFPTSAQYAAG